MKRFYVHRSVDLMNVAYGDTVFRTRREAEASIRQYERNNYMTDLLLVVNLKEDSGITFEEIENDIFYYNIEQNPPEYIDSFEVLLKR